MGNGNGFKVKATREGFYGEGIKKEGAHFSINFARDFSSIWMKDLTQEGNLAELAKADKAEYLAERNPVAPIGVTPERAVEIEAEVRAEIEADVRAELEDEVRTKILAEIKEAEEVENVGDNKTVEGGSLSDEKVEDIKAALEMLSNDNSAHWTKAGLPEVSVVTSLLGDNDVTLTRKLLTEIAPNCVRKEVV